MRYVTGYMTDATRARIGLRIRQARKHSGLTLDALAARVGSSRQHLIKLEKGQHGPGRPMLAAIAAATGKRQEFFTSDDDEEDALDLTAALRLLIRAEINRARVGGAV